MVAQGRTLLTDIVGSETSAGFELNERNCGLALIIVYVSKSQMTYMI